MASYRGHLAFSTALGAAYGALASFQWQMDWGPVFLGAGLTALGGLLPDLDSDSSVPVRELFGLAAAAAPFLLIERVTGFGFTREQTLVLLASVYLLIRYGLRTCFSRFTVHRGMFHSLPALLIPGMLVFLFYVSPLVSTRLYLAGGVMLGFLSHLVLDELYDTDITGAKLSVQRYAGSPLKFYSASWLATGVTYAILAGLTWLAYVEFNQAVGSRDEGRDLVSRLLSRKP